MLTSYVVRFVSRMKHEHGGVLISFAVLLPLLMILMAFVFNSLKMFMAKAKVGDVSAEIGLMISATSEVANNQELSTEVRKTLVDYVKEFFPEATKLPLVTVNYSTVENDLNENSLMMTYRPSIEIELPFPFYDRLLSGEDKNFSIVSSDISVKKKMSQAVDIVFVIDFSASQQGAGLRLLKGMFKDLTSFILSSNSHSKVAMVPFSTGVAVKYPETNQRGGAKAGCSMLFVPKKEWAINYDFWGDKAFAKNYKNLNEQLYHMDNYRYKYYTGNLAKSKPTMSLNQVQRNWCRENASFGSSTGQEKYTCFDNRFVGTDLDGSKIYLDDIFTQRSRKIITDEYTKAVKIKSKQLSTLTVEHDDAIDYEATLNKMFSDEAIITFPMLWTGMETFNYRPFGKMCHNAGWWGAKGDLASAKPYSWLIELTNNIKELDEFQNMNAQGYTATASGLVRSVPVMMKGRNPRKVFVVMSDGDDSSAPKKVTERYLKQYKLCDKIKSGMLDRAETNTKRVDIYYVSTTNSKVRVNNWQDNCTGKGNAATAVNRNDVVNLIKGYLSDEIGNFTH